MKLVITFILLSFVSSYAMSDFIDKYEKLSAQQAAKKWGRIPFNKEKFKNVEKSGYELRRKMVAEILEKKLYVGQSIETLAKDLGNPRGYFISDVMPSYLLMNPQKRKQEAWQLVFEPDDSGKKVEKVTAYKTCCKAASN